MDRLGKLNTYLGIIWIVMSYLDYTYLFILIWIILGIFIDSDPQNSRNAWNQFGDVSTGSDRWSSSAPMDCG